MPITIPTAASVAGFFGRVFKSPWFYVILAFIAIAGGTFWYLRADKADAVEQAATQATQNANTNATIQTQAAQVEYTERVQPIDQRYIILREQTTRDYANVRNEVQSAPVEERDARAPRILIDTVNSLDRLRGQREPAPAGVSDAEPPVG